MRGPSLQISTTSRAIPRKGDPLSLEEGDFVLAGIQAASRLLGAFLAVRKALVVVNDLRAFVQRHKTALLFIAAHLGIAGTDEAKMRILIDKVSGPSGEQVSQSDLDWLIQLTGQTTPRRPGSSFKTPFTNKRLPQRKDHS